MWQYVIKKSGTRCRSGVLWGVLFYKKIISKRYLLVQGLALRHSTLCCANYKLQTINYKLSFCLVFENYEMCFIPKNFKIGPSYELLIMRFIVLEKMRHYLQNILSVE